MSDTTQADSGSTKKNSVSDFFAWLLGTSRTFTAAPVIEAGATGTAPLVIRQTGGTPGTDEIQLSHDGSRALVESKDGPIILKPAAPSSNAGGIVIAECDNETAGNARGRRSVDLQLGRNAATQVVSGRHSGMIGGAYNTLSGNGSFIGGGKSNTVSSNYSTAIGQGNSISGNDYNFASGLNNTVTGGRATAMGQSNTVSASMGFAQGANNDVKNTAGYGMAMGRGNTVHGDYGFVAGKNNSISADVKGAAAIGMEHGVSGAYSFAAGGYNSTVSGKYALVGGYNNTVSGHNTLVAGKGNTVGGTASIVAGQGNTCGTFYSAVFGKDNNSSGSSGYSLVSGDGNTNGGTFTLANGQDNLVDDTSFGTAIGKDNDVQDFCYQTAFGRNNTLSGANYQFAFGTTNTITGKGGSAFGGWNSVSGAYSYSGGYYAHARLHGQWSRASKGFSTVGQGQHSLLTIQASTANNTPTELYLNGSSARMTIPTDTTWAFSVIVAARRTDADNESAGWRIDGVIDNNAGVVALVGSPAVTVLGDDSGATWTVAAEADNTADALVIKATGENAKTIRWLGSVHLAEITG